MTNAEMKSRVLKRLQSAGQMEMMRDELEQLLEAELNKPESEMDTQLVQELVDALEEDALEGDALEKDVSDEERRASWEGIEAALHAGTKESGRITVHRHASGKRRAAICAAILIALLCVSMGGVYAFRWTGFMKILKPLDETFGLHSVNSLIEPEDEQPSEQYFLSDTDIIQQQYAAQDEFPAMWNGVRILPQWTPESVAFAQGSLYQDDNITVLSALYQGEEKFLNLSVVFGSEDEHSSFFEFEKKAEQVNAETVGGAEITYYFNSDIGMFSASWVGQDVHFCLFGNVTEEDMQKIVHSMVE